MTANDKRKIYVKGREVILGGKKEGMVVNKYSAHVHVLIHKKTSFCNSIKTNTWGKNTHTQGIDIQYTACIQFLNIQNAYISPTSQRTLVHLLLHAVIQFARANA